MQRKYYERGMPKMHGRNPAVKKRRKNALMQDFNSKSGKVFFSRPSSYQHSSLVILWKKCLFRAFETAKTRIFDPFRQKVFHRINIFACGKPVVIFSMRNREIGKTR